MLTFSTMQPALSSTASPFPSIILWLHSTIVGADQTDQDYSTKDYTDDSFLNFMDDQEETQDHESILATWNIFNTQIDAGGGANQSFIGTQNHSQFRHYTLQKRRIRAFTTTSRLVLIPVVSILGIVCNCLNMVTLAWRVTGRQLPSSRCLLALAISDTIWLLFGMLQVSPLASPAFQLEQLRRDAQARQDSNITAGQYSQESQFFKVYEDTSEYIKCICKTAYKCSTWFVFAYNLDRYFSICHPIFARAQWLRHYSPRLLISIAVGSVLLSLESPLIRHQNLYQTWFGNQTGNQIAMAYQIVDLTISILIPVATIPILNCSILHELRKVLKREDILMGLSGHPTNRENHHDVQQPSSSQRLNLISSDGGSRFSWNAFKSNWGTTNAQSNNKDNSTSSSPNSSANRLLLAVMIPFVICLLPEVPKRICIQFWKLTRKKGHQSKPMFRLYCIICELLLFVQAASHFWLYCLLSKRYRSLFQQRICAKSNANNLMMDNRLQLSQSKASRVDSSNNNEKYKRRSPIISRSPQINCWGRHRFNSKNQLPAARYKSEQTYSDEDACECDSLVAQSKN